MNITFETILIMGLIAIVSFFIGYRVSSIWNHYIFRQILTDLKVSDKTLEEYVRRAENQLIEEGRISPDQATTATSDNLPELDVRIEQHGDMLYAYRTDTNEFLGQGEDQASLIANMAGNIKNVKCMIREGNGLELINKDAA